MVHGWKKAPPWNGTEIQTEERAKREGVALEENESRFGCQRSRCDDARSEVTRSGLVLDDRRHTVNFDISGRGRRCESPAMDIIRIFREAYPDVDLRHVSAPSSSSSSSGSEASADTGQRNEESDASGRDPYTQQNLISWSHSRMPSNRTMLFPSELRVVLRLSESCRHGFGSRYKIKIKENIKAEDQIERQAAPAA